jgi:hypothetical protein
MKHGEFGASSVWVLVKVYGRWVPEVQVPLHLVRLVEAFLVVLVKHDRKLLVELPRGLR